MKRFLCLTLALVFAIGICFSAPVTITASAEEPHFVYNLNKDKTGYEITQILESTEVLNIPSEYNGLEVVGVKLGNSQENTVVKKIVFPSSIQYIDGFSYFTSLSTVEFSNGLKSIKGFQSCYSLTSVTIPNGVEEIGAYFLSDSFSLNTVIFEGNVGKLCMFAFSNCSNLSTITFKNNGTVSEIERGVFTETSYFNLESNWRTITVDEVNYEGLYINNCLFATRNLGEKYVVADGTTVIASLIFSGVKEVVLPSSLTAIPDEAFSNACLTSIEIPESVKKIGRSAFGAEMSSSDVTLTSIKLNEGLEEISDEAFKYTEISELTIPNTVTKIGNDAIHSETVYLGTGITEFGTKNLSKTTTLNIPDGSAFSFEQGALYKDNGATVIGCLSNISELTLKEGTTKVADYAFFGSNLTKIILADSVTEIGEGAFSNCYNLTEIELSAELKTIGQSAFENCRSLSSIEIPGKVEVIGWGAFHNCEALTSFAFPDSVTHIAEYKYLTGFNDGQYALSCFEGCTNLKEISVGKNFNSDLKTLIQGLSLNNITLPESNKNYFKRNGVVFQNYKNYISVLLVTEDFNGKFVIPKEFFDFNYEDEGRLISAGLKITEYLVEEGNSRLASVDGVVYSKDLTELILYPDYATATEYTILDSVTRIKVDAFSGAKHLAKVTIPNSVERIDEGAFGWCEELEEIIVPDSVEIIGKLAFSGCPKLESVKLSNNLTVIPSGAFNYCSALNAITIGSKVKIIEQGAFEGCTSLEKVTIPSSVLEIGANVFRDCDKLSEIVVPEGVKSIGNEAFAHCDKLNKITLPSTLINIGCNIVVNTAYSNNHQNWGDGEGNYTDGLYINNYLLQANNVSEQFEFKPGVKNFSGIFVENEEIQSIVVPDTVNSISDMAFEGCRQLNTITLGKEVQYFGENLFGAYNDVLDSKNIITTGNKYVKQQGGLTYLPTTIIKVDKNYTGKIVIPETIEKIYQDQFRDAALTEVEIPESVTVIGSSAFENSKLTKVVIPDSVVELYGAAFKNCSDLTSVKLSENLRNNVNYRRISDDQYYDWFRDCVNLKEVIIPEGLNRISTGAFWGCISLESITIPSSVTSLGMRTFFCSGITNITIPDTVVDMENNVFVGCKNLETVTLSKNVRGIDASSFEGCENLTSINISSKVDVLSENAFLGCVNLSSIEIPEEVKRIEDHALGYYVADNSAEPVTYRLNRAVQNSNELVDVVTPNLYLAPASTESSDSKYKKVPGFTIYGKKGSAAEEYANENGFNFIESENNHECTPGNEWITENGKHWKVCSSDTCGEIIGEPEDCSGGTATCTKKAVCETCKHEYGDIDPTNHAEKSTEWTTENDEHWHECACGKLDKATCSGGIATCKKQAVCETCKKAYGNVNAKNHVNIKTLSAVPATCKATGLTEGKQCLDCQTITVPQNVVPKTTNHSYTYKVTTPAKCGKNAVETGTCSICSGTVTREVQNTALTHTYTKYEQVKAATCTAEGLERAKCDKGCGATHDREIKALGHNIVKDPAVAPTCTVAGKTEGSHCTRCNGATVAQNVVVATGHKTTLVGKKAATFEAEGHTGAEVCSVCKQTINAGSVIKKLTFTTPVVTAVATKTGIKVTWNKVENAQSYIVYKRVYNESTEKWSGWEIINGNATELSLEDSNVVLGTKYRYTVRAKNGNTLSPYKSTGTVKYNVTPTVKVSNATSGIKVSWSTAANATGYRVYRSTLSNGKWSGWKNMGTAKANKTAWTDKSVKTGVTYKYTVRAVYNKVLSSYNKDGAVSLFLSTPTVKIANIANGIQVKWNSVSGATGYIVYSSQFDPATNKWSGWANRGTVNATSWTDTTVKSGVTYKYTVRALNGNTLSAYKATGGLIYLAEPTVKISNAAKGIKVKWSQCDGATGYTVYRSEYNSETKKWSKWKSRGTAAATKSSWTDKKVTSGKTYKYTVRAVNGNFKSSYVSTGSLLYLAQPTVTVKAVDNGINVAWTQCAGATGYRVYRSELVNGEWSKWKSMGTAKANKNNWTDKSAEKGKTYKYTVRTVNGKTLSSYADGTAVSR